MGLLDRLQWAPSYFRSVLPVVRQQFIDAAVQMCGQSGQHVIKVRVRVVTVDLCRLHEAHDDGGALAGQLTACK